MCNMTKSKIAECVKKLMKTNEISKISIHDIMDETHMSRQSFYYHFKDIYDVLEWITHNDFAEVLGSDEYETLEDWFADMLQVLNDDRIFYSKLAKEISWPRLTATVKPAIHKQISRIMYHNNEVKIKKEAEELNPALDFFAMSITYCLIDYAYRNKNASDIKTKNDFKMMMDLMSGNSNKKKSTVA